MGRSRGTRQDLRHAMPEAVPLLLPGWPLPAKGRVDCSALFPLIDAHKKPIWVKVDKSTIALHAYLVPRTAHTATEEILRLTILDEETPDIFSRKSAALELEVEYDESNGVFRFDAHNDPTFWAQLSLVEWARVMRAGGEKT
tara:strand:- start:886 stop:1311 length:426 start_codon:yes stop_codon:yes gene_type:complete